MKRSLYYILYVTGLLFVSFTLEAQVLLPKPDPPRLVNDFAGLLQPSEAEALENKLVAFNDSTSNQIAVVIVDDLQGYDRSEFAFKVAQDWGIGQAEFRNGVLVLLKTKTEQSAGQVFIATGYGLEGAIPDITCAEIIDKEMIPRFRNGDYYGGLDAGTDVLMALASGEYSFENYGEKPGVKASGTIPAAFFVIIVILIIILISRGNSNNRHFKTKGTSGLPLWLLMSMLGGGRSHSGSWGGFSGRSGGGFGGFGGGSFGGGGAGGSW